MNEPSATPPEPSNIPIFLPEDEVSVSPPTAERKTVPPRAPWFTIGGILFVSCCGILLAGYFFTQTDHLKDFTAFEPTPTIEVTSIPTPKLPTAQPTPSYAQLNLTPEENANNGMHWYEFKTEIPCDSNPVQTENFIVTFSEGSVVLERTVPESFPWSHTYTKISTNTYFMTHEDGVKTTIVFGMDGFTMSSSSGYSFQTCGSYIRTLIP